MAQKLRSQLDTYLRSQLETSFIGQRSVLWSASAEPFRKKSALQSTLDRGRYYSYILALNVRMPCTKPKLTSYTVKSSDIATVLLFDIHVCIGFCGILIHLEIIFVVESLSVFRGLLNCQQKVTRYLVDNVAVNSGVPTGQLEYQHRTLQPAKHVIQTFDKSKVFEVEVSSHLVINNAISLWTAAIRAFHLLNFGLQKLRRTALFLWTPRFRAIFLRISAFLSWPTPRKGS